ncbi:MAG: hypothetical protein D3903_05175 [Candidatus Electrothrix sp. GM3_4]|nr:hypothetical protein [Candidatus Electrothrix sp. GM3_4]
MLNGMKVRMRDPIRIVDEIEELVNVYGIKEFMFADGIFSNPLWHVTKICEEIKRRKIQVQWDAWCDIKNINREFLETMTSAGCRSVIISPDAYSNSALQGLNKGITTREVRKAVKLLVDWPGLRVGFCFFLTTPGETFWGYVRTMFYYFTTVPFILLQRKGGSGFSWIRIEPDTQVRETAVRDGLISEETELLPKDIESLRRLFYIKPALRFLDPPSRILVDVMEKGRNMIRLKRAKR